MRLRRKAHLRSDSELEKSVPDELYVVTLAHDVNTWSEYKEATRIGSLTDDVCEVLNRLRFVDVDYPWDECMDNP